MPAANSTLISDVGLRSDDPFTSHSKPAPGAEGVSVHTNSRKLPTVDTYSPDGSKINAENN